MKNILFIATLVSVVTVPAIAVQAQTPGTESFTDVSSSNPYYGMIHEMRDELIIKGYTDGTFKPNLSISRKHVAALLERVLPLEPEKDAVEFKDVPASHPYYKAIQKAQQAGIFDGDVDGKFHPEAPLTRVQMAKVLDLAFKLEVKETYDFPDVPTSHWGNEHVRALYSNGITTGDKGYFKPNEAVTRQHYAVFLHQALNMDKVEAVDPIPQPEPDQESNSSTGSKPEPKPDTGKPDTKPSNPNVSKPTEAEIQKLTAKAFNDSIKGNPFFETSDGVPATEQSFGNKDFVRVLANVEALVKDKYPKFEVLTIAGAIYLQEPDYTSELKEYGLYLGTQVEVWYTGDNGIKFGFDQSNEQSVNLTRDLINIAYPDLDLEAEFNSQVDYTNERFKEDRIDDSRITKVYRDFDGFDLIRIGTSRFQGMNVDVKRN
jgi:hypothetical protein